MGREYNIQTLPRVALLVVALPAYQVLGHALLELACLDLVNLVHVVGHIRVFLLSLAAVRGLVRLREHAEHAARRDELQPVVQVGLLVDTDRRDEGWCTVARMGIAARAVGPMKRVERSAARLSSERMRMGIEDGRDPHKIERPHGRAWYLWYLATRLVQA
eukprot:2195259-Prymnesium_polylepis.1